MQWRDVWVVVVTYGVPRTAPALSAHTPIVHRRSHRTSLGEERDGARASAPGRRTVRARERRVCVESEVCFVLEASNCNSTMPAYILCGLAHVHVHVKLSQRRGSATLAVPSRSPH